MPISLRCSCPFFPHSRPHVIPVKTGIYFFLYHPLVFFSPLGDNPFFLAFWGCHDLTKAKSRKDSFIVIASEAWQSGCCCRDTNIVSLRVLHHRRLSLSRREQPWLFLSSCLQRLTHLAMPMPLRCSYLCSLGRVKSRLDLTKPHETQHCVPYRILYKMPIEEFSFLGFDKTCSK